MGVRPNRVWPSSIIRENRSQSEVVSIVLVLGMVLAGSVVILGLGVSAIGDTENQLSEDRAEKTLTQFDSKAGLVALGEADSQHVSLPSGTGEEFTVDETEGRLTIDVTNRTTNSRVDWLSEPLVEVTLGAMEFENDNARLAYQGGGVFRTGGRNGSMLSPPEFHYRNGTLTLPIVNVTGDGSLDNSATVTRTNESRAFPIPERANYTNPLDNHEVEVTVQSDYYEGWGQYFEQRTDGEVEYDHDAKTATLILKTPIGEQTVKNAISSTAGEFEITGKGSRTDSYNSSKAKYATSIDSDGNISVAGDVTIGGSAQIDGDVRTGGEFTCKSNSATMNGSVYWTSGFNDKHSCTQDTDEEIDGVEGEPSVNPYIESTVESLEENNDNDDSDADVASDQLSYSGQEATLTAGSYYLEDLTVPTDHRLVLDTEGEKVSIAVEEYVSVVASDIEIEGSGEVNIFVNGTGTTNGDHFEFDNQGSNLAEVDTGSIENSTQLWVYGKDDMEATVGGSGQGKSSKFIGVIYAPSDGTGSSVIDVDAGEVFGGVIAGDVTVANGGAVHYDKILEEKQSIPENTKVVRITFLHITENEIRIE